MAAAARASIAQPVSHPARIHSSPGVVSVEPQCCHRKAEPGEGVGLYRLPAPERMDSPQHASVTNFEVRSATDARAQVKVCAQRLLLRGMGTAVKPESFGASMALVKGRVATSGPI